MSENGDGGSGGREAFCTTRWSLVIQAGDGDDDGRSAALDELCGAYWYPIYAFVRRSGNAHHDAQDLTQGFFEHVAHRMDMSGLDPESGRFRSYLLKSVKNYMTKEHRRQRAQKRGGGVETVSMDGEEFDRRFQAELADQLDPEALYHRSWADTLLRNVLAELGEEYAKAGKGALFEALKEKLAEQPGASSNTGAAEELGMTVGAVGVALHRLRERYRKLLRSAVRDTLSGQETEMDVDAELQQLIGARA